MWYRRVQYRLHVRVLVKVQIKIYKVWECVRVRTKQKNYKSAIAGLGAVHNLKTMRVWFWVRYSLVKGQTTSCGCRYDCRLPHKMIEYVDHIIKKTTAKWGAGAGASTIWKNILSVRVRWYCCFNSKIVGPAAGSASVLDSKGESRTAGEGTKLKLGAIRYGCECSTAR